MRTALLLLSFGFALRILFLWAGGAGAFDVSFQGDAHEWQRLAAVVAAGGQDESLRIPLRPPGMHWLVASLWNGDPATAWRLRVLFAVLGAAVAPLVWLLLRRHAAPAVAVLAAALCAAASHLIVIGSGLHAELPYLVLVLLSLFDQERLRTAPCAAVALRWGALHAVLCLLRAEHLLTFIAFAALLAVQLRRRGARALALAAIAFLAALVPWHLAAFAQIDAYNREGAPALPEAMQRAPGGLPWRAAALAAVRELPAFQQGPVFGFVTATVQARGGTVVETADLGIVEEAYGVTPEPLGRPFVCLYGGLNFFLGNSPEAAGGFSQAALDRPPPLTGGAARYPKGLERVLPRNGTLALSYPPHLDRLVHGYRAGFAELTAAPAAAAGRLARKLWHGLQGAASGLSGYNLPIGLSGVRRPVDMVIADGAMAAAFRVAVLAIALAGLWSLRRQPWLWPWLAFAATKLVVVVAYFGYARQGALIVPVVCLGVAAAAARWLPPQCARRGVGICLLAGLLLLEAIRAATVDATFTDPSGAPIAALDPTDHRAFRIDYR